jgi:hypothetical protein
MGKYPRVLIVNAQSIYKKNATGITLQSIWSEWDADCLLEIYSDPMVMDESNHKFKSYCISPNNVIRLARGRVAQSINSNIKATNTQQRSNNKIKSYLRQFAVCELDSLAVKLDESTLEAIRVFQPQAIYTLGASVSILRLVNKLSVQLNIPVIMHFMDNWAEHIQWEDNPLLSLYKSSLKKKMLACIKRCKLVVTISSSMAEAYHEKFQKETLVLMNTVDISRFKGLTSKDTGVIHFVYAGGLHLDRWKALREIALSIQQTNGKGILDIFTSKDNIELYRSGFETLPVAFYEAVPHERIDEVYQKADVLVHTEIESENLKGFFKYSISTKIPEYLATGKPILFYGPRDMKLFEYLLQNQVALTAGTKEELYECVKRLMSEENFTEMCENAQCLAEKNHCASKNQKELHDAIETVVLD